MYRNECALLCAAAWALNVCVSRMFPGSRRVSALKVLSGALKRPRDLPFQDPATWREVRALATELGVGPALWGAVHEIQDRLPPDVIEELHQAQLGNAVRNARLRHTLTQIVRTLN